MAEKKKNRPRLFKNVRIKIFVQFLLIFSAIVLGILLSSGSVYMTLVETHAIFDMRKATEQLCELDFNSDNILEQITNIENSNNILVEIYAKENGHSSEYNKNIYAKYFPGIIFSKTGTFSYKDSTSPIVNYYGTDFTPVKEYDNGSFSGITKNSSGTDEHFVLVTADPDDDYLYITAVKYALLESQANTLVSASIIITSLIFLTVSIVFYFYITRITKPLSDIIEFTRIMTEEQDKSVRIPSENDILTPQTDSAITNINSLYESLMLTQERLVEKSEVLAAQLHEKENEQKSRAKFIADTSHELKTPISIIQGYAEGIKYILDDKQATFEYCDTIIEECSRMNDLVIDMMNLSKIQHSDVINCESFSVREFVDERIRLHQMIFENNDITAENRLTDDIIGYADISKLQFVVNNLFSNAVSYIGGDEKKIIIRYKELPNCYRIIFYNTGAHIAEENIDKIWDSFYREDSARQRSDGHFGLGLSIVKAVQGIHSQQCGFNNADGGVEFWFDVAKGNQNNSTK